MFELLRNILLAITGIFALYWFMSESGGWQELAEKYRTENSLPTTLFFIWVILELPDFLLLPLLPPIFNLNYAYLLSAIAKKDYL